jgi:hypothetical protein
MLLQAEARELRKSCDRLHVLYGVYQYPLVDFLRTYESAPSSAWQIPADALFADIYTCIPCDGLFYGCVCRRFIAVEESSPRTLEIGKYRGHSYLE